MTTPEAPPPPQKHKDASARSVEKTQTGIAAVLGAFSAKVLPALREEIEMLANLCEKEKLALQDQCTAQADELSTQVASLNYQLQATKRSKTEVEMKLSAALARAGELSAQVEALKARVQEGTAEFNDHLLEAAQKEEQEKREANALYWKEHREAKKSTDVVTNVVRTQANAVIAEWLKSQGQLSGMLGSANKIIATKEALYAHVERWLDTTFQAAPAAVLLDIKGKMNELLSDIKGKGLVAGFPTSEGGGDLTSRPFLVFEDGQWTLSPAS